MNYVRRRTRIAGAVGLLLALVVSAGCGGSSGDPGSQQTNGTSQKITIGTLPWDEGLAATHLWKELLQAKGYTVTVQQLDAGPIFDAVASGQIDLFLDMWPNYHQPFLQRYQDKIERIGPWYGPTDLNLAVPDYVDGIETIEDLKGRAEQFGNRIVGIEAGSELMGVLSKNVIPQYGLDGYKVIEGSTPAMLGALEKAVRAKEPIVVTLWHPHWAFTKHPIKPLKDTKSAFGGAGEIEVVSSKDFARDHPEAVAWLKNFELDSERLGGLELVMQEKGEGNEAAAVRQWIGENKSLTDGWFA